MSIYIAHCRRKTSNALDTLALSEQECHYTSDRGGQATANSKSLVQRQQRTDDQVS